jgi:hypothetical protein
VDVWLTRWSAGGMGIPMRDLEVRSCRSMIWSARFPALIGAPREPLLALQVFDVSSCNSTLLRYMSMIHNYLRIV